LSYKRCDFVVFGVNQVVAELGWSLRRDFGYLVRKIRSTPANHTKTAVKSLGYKGPIRPCKIRHGVGLPYKYAVI
jgi:hypothetical protein